MPSSQNDIGLFANVLTERGQEQIDLSDGLVHTLTIPPAIVGITMIVLMQADGGAFRFTAIDGTPPTTTTGIKIGDGAEVCWIPADPSLIQIIRDGADTGKVNVAYYTFARLNEV